MPAGDRKVQVEHEGKLDPQEIERQRNDLFAKFAEQISIGISATDETGRIVFWNPRLEELTGLSVKETLGEFIWDVHLRLLPEISRTHRTLAHLKKSFTA